MPKSPYEVLNDRAQACIATTPVIVLGSGASIGAGIPGMGDLREHIKTIPEPEGLTEGDAQQWHEFKAALNDTDLESALQKVNLPENIDDLVVQLTWNFLHPKDLAALRRLLADRSPNPLTQLFQHLLRSTNRHVDVVTPNYDRIAEYAADLGGIYHETGFSYGHVRKRLGDSRQTVHIDGTQQPRVNIWKVHGSFDWFKDPQGIIHALPVSCPCPDDWTPAIVTPGLQKYRRVYDEPFVSIKAGSDRAFSNGSGFFCSGYGFNDEHIQTKLQERCRSKKVPLVLITYELTAAAKAFFDGEFCQEYLAVESASGGCRIFCPEYPGGETVSEGKFWELESFLTLIQS